MSVENSVRSFLCGIGQGSKMYFVGETDKNPLSYKAGEPITFKLKVTSENGDVPVPFISVHCEGDDGRSIDETVEANNDGFFYITTSLHKDGFVRVIAKALDENKELIKEIDVFEGGAGADTDKIVLATETPDGYFEFWEKLRETASKIPTEVLYEKQIDYKEGYVVKEMYFKTIFGKFISLLLAYPENARPGTLKMKMSFMGYGVYKATPMCFSDCLGVSMNTHDVGNFLTEEEYEQLRKVYKGYGFDAEENKAPETSYWYKIFMRNMQAFFIFKDHELLNKKDYIFCGGSQGAMQAANMALHTGYATRCTLHVPWFCNMWAPEKDGRMRGWHPDTSVATNYFDTGLAASYLTCPLYIEAGLGDYIRPPSGEMAMYNSVKSPKMIRFVQNQTHSYFPKSKQYYTLCNGYDNPDYHYGE